MSIYRFILTDYHAVEKADINVSGITVLAGANSSGKSTVARWLGHTIYALNHFDDIVEKDAMLELISFIEDMHRVAASLNAGNAINLRNIAFDFRHSSITLQEAEASFRLMRKEMSDALHETITPDTDIAGLRKYDEFLLIDSANVSDAEEYIDMAMLSIDRFFQDLLLKVNRRQQLRTSEDLAKTFAKISNSAIESPEIDLSFKEDDNELLKEKSFGIPLSLKESIYIDTKDIGQAFRSYVSSELSNMMCKKHTQPGDAARNLARLITSIIGGDVEVSDTESQPFLRRKPYVFHDRQGKSFNLLGAATGILSFSYILQLLKNGWLDESVILIIDEPESHLHPQWIVEYARILVLLQKMLGVKVVVSSHSPDMISAIHDISEAESIADKVSFYLTTKNDATNRYIFEDLGFNIEKIFDSFNIALERISMYGTRP